MSNNNAGNTAISAGTYHKSLLETNGKIVAPTNVAMKGAKSILMKPGFEVKAGSILRQLLKVVRLLRVHIVFQQQRLQIQILIIFNLHQSMAKYL